MSKLKLFLTAAPFALCVAGLSQASLAQEQAAPEEIVQKVTAAAGYPSEAGEPGLKKFQSKDAEYVWKDRYVVVNNCETEQLAAHPRMIVHNRRGRRARATDCAFFLCSG